MIKIAQCTRPLKAVREKSGKVVILDRSSFDSYQKSGRLSYKGADHTQRYLTDKYGLADIFDVPCGHCLNCRLNYAKRWSQRCLLETKSWSESWFLTLTYDDENLPTVCDYSTGEFMAATLVPKDLVLFLKRLREEYRAKYNHMPIRFFLGAEYGDTSFRPHYHLLVFNLPLFDLTYYAKSPLGDCYYNSETLTRLWSKGHCVVGEVTAQSAAYVARYCQKKAGKQVDYDALGIHKEYVNMSRNPGIALPYLQAHYQEIYLDDVIYLPDGQIATPMRYFDTKAEALGVDIESIKLKRILTSSELTNQRVDEVSREYYGYLEDLEKEYAKAAKVLTRNKC